MKKLFDLEDFKLFCYNNFCYEFSCECTDLVIELLSAQERVLNWLGYGGCCNLDCTCGFDITNYIYTLAFFNYKLTYETVGERIVDPEFTVYQMMLNDGVIDARKL